MSRADSKEAGPSRVSTPTLPVQGDERVTDTPKDDQHNHEHHVQIKTDFWFLPIPKRLRYDPSKPAHFGLLMNATFGFASTFVAANLYYCQPLLIQFSESFGVSYDRVSNIPTLVQGGYATGLLLIAPMGDLVRRRPLILLCVFAGTALTIGLSITPSIVAFEVLTYLTGIATVTPQILMPLAADLSPPDKQASAIALVLSGLLFGILIARVLAGIIAQFVSWRVVYYLAIGVQSFVFGMLYLVLPDYPAKNGHLTYHGILLSMAKYAVTEPLLIQAALINIASSACFTSFWVTLTFLLGGPPYYYSTIAIGLFGLVGMLGVAAGPFIGKLIDRLVPWYATLAGTLCLIVFQAVQTGAGGVNVAAVVLACFGLDVFRQLQQVSLQSAAIAIEPAARSRLNSVMILSLFIGQVMGTSVGTKVFVQYGWRAAAGLNMAWYAWQLLILLLRGPHCERKTWVGYQGGLEARKGVVTERRRQRGQKEVEGRGDGVMEKNEVGDNEKEVGDDKKESEGRERRTEKSSDRQEEEDVAGMV